MKKKRVLVVEDVVEVALDIASSLSEAGFDVVGPYRTVEEAMQAAVHDEVDGAVLDANLNGRSVGPVGVALSDRRIPIVVVSGYAKEFLPLSLAHAPLIGKPFDSSRLVALLREMCPSTGGRKALPARKKL